MKDLDFLLKNEICVEMGSSTTFSNVSPLVKSGKSDAIENHNQQYEKASCEIRINNCNTTNNYKLYIDPNDSAVATQLNENNRGTMQADNNSSKLDLQRDCSTLPIQQLPDAEQVFEKLRDDDKYPCLRRALSCSETPILPLGTYAVEFGFDVCSLPFKPFHKRSLSTSKNEDLNELSEEKFAADKKEERKKGSENGLRDKNESSTEPKSKDDSRQTANDKSVFSNQSKRINKSKQLLETSMEMCPENVRCGLISPKRPKRDLSSMEPIIQTIKQAQNQTYKEMNESEDEKERYMRISKNYTNFLSNDDTEEQIDSDSSSGVFEESYWYATKWKKDNRKWLWKCSRRTKHEIEACDAMSKRHRNDSSTLSLKPNTKQP